MAETDDQNSTFSVNPSIPAPRSRTPLRVRQKSECFIKGPLPLDWISAAAMLPGRTLAVGLALWFEAGCKKSMTVTLTTKLLASFGVERGAKMRALRKLKEAHLIEYKVRCGKNPVVRILRQQ